MSTKTTLLLLAIGLLLASCSPDADPTATSRPSLPPQKPTPFTDAAGLTVDLPAFPQRIVIEGKQTQMIVDFFYLFPGQSTKLVGIQKKMQTADNFLLVIDPAIEEKLNLEENASAEQVAPLKPDLVILKSMMRESLAGGLEALRIPVVYMDFENPDQFAREITNLGILLNQQPRSGEINALFATWQARATQPLANLLASQKPTALVVQYSHKDGVVAFSVPAANFLQTATVEMAGGIPVWKDDLQESGWNTVSLEQIAAWDADIIFVINYFGSSSQAVAEILADPVWANIRAVREGKVHAFPADFISWDQPDPRWFLGLNWLAHKLHPDLVPFETDALVRQFYQEFYQLEDAIIEQQVLPLLKGDLP